MATVDLVIIRYNATVTHYQEAYEYINTRVAFGSSLIIGTIAPGIYLSPPNNFTTLLWFKTAGFKFDKMNSRNLLRVLTAHAFTRVIVI